MAGGALPRARQAVAWAVARPQPVTRATLASQSLYGSSLGWLVVAWARTHVGTSSARAPFWATRAFRGVELEEVPLILCLGG